MSHTKWDCTAMRIKPAVVARLNKKRKLTAANQTTAFVPF